MDHATAAELRDTLNETRFVQGPDENRSRPFRLARVNQPGYLNGEPMYEVLLDADDPDYIHLTSELLELVVERDGYIRIDEKTIHIRDWTAEESGGGDGVE